MPDNRLPTNQSQLDIVEKLDEIKDAIAQGGGGTGGHTIIDENGNSMTARAGLQFVGGANVSDDATNNKTIVDLASAGGIDGVFIDTGNVIVQPTSYTPSTFSYTATEDCALYIEIPCKGGFSTFLQIDGVNTQGFNVAGGANTTNYGIVTALLKKGQVATLSATDFPSVTPDYAVYGIQTGTTHSKFQPVIYSTEEREIGVWTDGKPLYQKTLNIASVGSVGSSLVTPIQINDIPFDYIEVVETNIYDSNDDRRYILPNLSKSANDRIFLHPYLDKNASPVVFYASLYTGGNIYSNLSDFNVTIRYTKSTDVAGSGTWTPQGVPTHHYSEDEQIVGTWIDGKTLYEKTFYIHDRQFNSSGECDFDVTSLNSDILMADNMASYYTFSISSTEYTRQFEKLVPEEGHVYAYGPANRQIATGYITVRYTKSS